MKKFLFKFLILFCSINILSFNIVYADDIDIEDNNYINELSIQTSNNAFPKINSRAYIVFDRNTNSILLGKNEHTKRKMASTTKIMTATIVIENSNLDAIATISKKAAYTGGSRLGLKTGDKITIRDLLYGLLLCSGNDAAVALAETIGGSIEGFAKLMNNKANSLGLTNTHFMTPHGLDTEKHYTTAYELAILSNYALKNETFLKIVKTKNHTITINKQPKTLSNTNELLGYLDGVYGIKTGFTNGANRCLVTACKRNDMDIICIVLGADTKKFRTQDSIKLIEYTFNNFVYVNMEEKIKNELNNLQKNVDFSVEKGIKQNVKFSCIPLENNILPIEKQSVSNIKVSSNINSNLIAPVQKDTVIGKIEATIGKDILISTNIIVDESVPKKSFMNYFYEYLKHYSLLNLI